MSSAEHLVACAIIRDGETHSRGFKEHWRIRAALGDADPYTKNRSDQMGFLTNTGRFVDRDEARMIGAEAGQCSAARRELLSSDVDSWEPAKPPKQPAMSRQVRRASSRSRARL